MFTQEQDLCWDKLLFNKQEEAILQSSQQPDKATENLPKNKDPCRATKYNFNYTFSSCFQSLALVSLGKLLFPSRFPSDDWPTSLLVHVITDIAVGVNSVSHVTVHWPFVCLIVCFLCVAIHTAFTTCTWPLNILQHTR